MHLGMFVNVELYPEVFLMAPCTVY